MSCNGFHEHASVLRSEVASLLHNGSSILAAWESLRKHSKTKGRNSVMCEASSLERHESRLEACHDILRELSAVGWGKEELSSLTFLKKGQSSLNSGYHSLSSLKFCAPGCKGIVDFLQDMRKECSSLNAEASAAIHFMKSAASDGKSAAFTNAVCAMIDVQRITSRLSACPEAVSIMRNASWNPEASLSTAKSLQSDMMSSWKGNISCPSPRTTNWDNLSNNHWWISTHFSQPHTKDCTRPPVRMGLPSCTRILNHHSTESKDFSCRCGTISDRSIFPTLEGTHCGTRRFCSNEAPGTKTEIGPQTTHMPVTPIRSCLPQCVKATLESIHITGNFTERPGEVTTRMEPLSIWKCKKYASDTNSCECLGYTGLIPATTVCGWLVCPNQGDFCITSSPGVCAPPFNKDFGWCIYTNDGGPKCECDYARQVPLRTIYGKEVCPNEQERIIPCRTFFNSEFFGTRIPNGHSNPTVRTLLGIT